MGEAGPARRILRDVTRACKEFDLLAAGDRVAVAVSGGKDSAALLELLLRYRQRVPFAFEVVALHVVATAAGFPDLRPELTPWLERLGVEAHYVPLELPAGERLPLDCFRCSWNRRKALFIAAHRFGCNKVAFGHHADDAAATTLMNLFFTGRLETMAPRADFFGGTFTVIRPLIYVAERDLARYARTAGLPDRAICPRRLTSRRAQMRALLRQFGRAEEQIRSNLWRAARREMGF